MPEPHTQYRATFAVVLAGVAAYSLLQSLVLPVLPTIQHSLHTSQDAVTWVLTGYLLSASVFTPILGRIGDMIGKEKTFVVALAALGVGSLVAALAPSIGVMIAARAIQGIGGGVFPLSFGIVRDVFPAQRVSAAIGVVAALAAAGGGLGIVLAGPLVDILDVHWLFWLPMIVVCLAAVAAQLVIPPSPVRAGGRINWLAGLLLSAWLVGLLVAVSEGPTWGWASTGVIGLALASAALAAAWVLVELRSEHPLIDMRMMRVPAVWTTNVVAFLFGVGLYCAFAFLPEYLQTPRSAGYGFGASVTRSGLFLLPMCVLMFAAGMVSGRATRRAGSKLVLLVAAAMSTGAFLALTLGDASQLDVYLSLGLLGAGIGLALSAMSNVIVEAVPFSQTGVASGMNANIRTIGGSIGAAVMASIVTSGSRAGGLPRASGYTNGFAMLTAATLLAALATLTIPALRRPDRSGGLEAARSLVLQPSVGEPAMTELPAALATSEGSGSV